MSITFRRLTPLPSHRIGGDALLDILQFMIERKKLGVVVFSSETLLRIWQQSVQDELFERHVWWIPQSKSFRYEGTWLRLIALNDAQDLTKLRGLTFDEGWYYGESHKTEMQYLALKELMLHSRPQMRLT